LQGLNENQIEIATSSPAIQGSDDINKPNQGQEALHELMRILEAMGIKAQVFYREKENEIFLEIRGNNLGIVIGKRGQTLDALEFILNLINKKKFDDCKELIIDAEGYREKKMDALKKILRGARDAALVTQDEIPLDPMSSSDRKIIHLLCRDLDGVTSESRGEGMNRRVYIRPAKDSRVVH
jgi:spoIIIJ-associated protein